MLLAPPARLSNSSQFPFTLFFSQMWFELEMRAVAKKGGIMSHLLPKKEGGGEQLGYNTSVGMIAAFM